MANGRGARCPVLRKTARHRSTRSGCAGSTCEERDKRLRADGNDQYLRVTGRSRTTSTIPIRRVTPRDAEDRPRRLRVHRRRLRGARHRGAACRRPASADVRIVEKGGDFGGTWYWNRYPGAQCDTASLVYMPLLEETGPHAVGEIRARAGDPRALPAYRPAVRSVRQRVVPHRGHRACEWDDAHSRWIISTNRGDAFTAQFVGMGTGPLHVPKLPGIPGIEIVQGTFVPHQPLGLRLHRRRSRPARRSTSSRQAGRHHRHRRNIRAVRAAPRARLQASCTCSSARRRRSTCAPMRRSIRSGSRKSRRRAGSSAGSRTSPPTRPAARPR